MTKIKLRNMLRNVVAYTTLIQKTDQHTSRSSALQDEIAEEVELLDQVTAGITVLMTKYGDDAMALLEELMPFFGELVDPSRPLPSGVWASASWMTSSSTPLRVSCSNGGALACEVRG